MAEEVKIKPETIICQIDEIVAYVYNHSKFEPDDMQRISNRLLSASSTLFSLEVAFREYRAANASSVAQP